MNPTQPHASPAATILIVEDERDQRELLADYLERVGFRTSSAAQAEDALARLEEVKPDLVLMDVRMPGMGGLRGLAEIHALRPELPVILLTAYARVRDAVHAMRDGAADYLEKPIDFEELKEVLRQHLPTHVPHPVVAPKELPEGFVVLSEPMRRVVHEIGLVAETDATVLVTGESGTGKERIARLCHEWSSRARGPWIALNCAAIPENLFESELFGHARGAFTGAMDERVGAFESARSGTLVLDEIGELPLEVQPKLLRVLDDKTFRRVGETKERDTDARVIACTNRDLEAEVAHGKFREDLFWRLNVFHVHVPPLRERRDELPALCRAILQTEGRRGSRIAAGAMSVLSRYDWPGNVRELKNVLQRAAILAGFDIVLEEHLPDRLRSAVRTPEPSRSESSEPLSVEEAERRAIRQALENTAGNRTKAARLLGISRRTLLYRLKRYGGEP